MNAGHSCALCGDPIQAGQAWMAGDDGRVVHAGCLYREGEAGEGDWEPQDATADAAAGG